MGGCEGLAGRLQQIVKAPVIEVGYIHQNPKLLHAGDESLPEGGKAEVGDVSGANLVFTVPGESHHSDPITSQDLHPVQVPGQGGAIFHRQEGCSFPAGPSVFDIGGGCPKIGPIALKRKLLSAYWYEGKCYEFNFSKFWTFTRTKFDCQETDTQIIWHVEQKTWRNRMVTDITCEKKDMLLVNYEAPNGKKLHNRLWNGGNGKGIVKLYRGKKLIDEVICENVGCEYGEYDSVD